MKIPVCVGMIGPLLGAARGDVIAHYALTPFGSVDVVHQRVQGTGGILQPKL